MKIGIIGAGSIARKMANTLNPMGLGLYAIGSRTKEKAQDFAKQFNAVHAYGSYEELLDDPLVDLVYIATPHSMHYDNIKSCLEHGKHVLCEKAFVLNAEQAREVFALSEKKGLLLTEAIWTRYLPSRAIINQCLKDIGTIRFLTANLSYNISHVKRLTSLELGGGALLDVGVYPLNFMAMVLGTGFCSFSTQANMVNGVDQHFQASFIYPDGAVASVFGGTQFISDRRGLVYGTEGSIEVENINNPSSLNLYDKERKLVKTIRMPEQLTGFEYEVQASIQAIKEKKTECPQMSHEESIRIMEITDRLRACWNFKFPIEC